MNHPALCSNYFALTRWAGAPHSILNEEDGVSKELVNAVADMKEPEALQLAKEMLEDGSDPMAILDAAREAMDIVGQRYEEGTYFPARTDAGWGDAEPDRGHGQASVGQGPRDGAPRRGSHRYRRGGHP